MKRDQSVWPVPTIDAAVATKLGVKIVEHYGDLLVRGTPRALRACGVVPKGFALPGEHGSGRKTLRTAALIDGRRICVYRVDSDTYAVRLMSSEQQLPQGDHTAIHKAADAERRELDDLLFRIECFPRSAADFKQRTLQIVWKQITTPLRLLEGELIPGCRIDDESLEDIRQACNELYWRLDEAHFSVDRRELHELQAKACRRDSRFQSFIADIVRPLKHRRAKR